jgi:hypothetical protein
VYANDLGTITPFTYTVPITVTQGRYAVLARFEGIGLAAQAPFRVTE